MKILMLADYLDVGGAETHVEALAAELARLGNDVAVASSGGKTAERLQKNGIKHILLPSVGRAPLVFASVCRAIGEEKPDVVHAHTRRTAFYASLPCKTRKIPLVVTAHALFSMDFPKNFLSFPGDVTIAVSEDIKNHLMKNCNLSPDKIKIVPNGVRLYKKRAAKGFKERKITFVSRLDADCSLGAQLLCKIAPLLAEKYPNIEITIVGGGTEYGKIAGECLKINRKYNRKLIKTVGAAENVTEFLQDASLFIGASRAALEAMAQGVPSILLGNEGYLGLIRESNLDIAMRTNLTCRGHRIDRDRLLALLFDEICSFFALPELEKENISDFSRHVVEMYFTVEQMTSETLEIYNDVLRSSAKRKRLLLCGYYGRGNLGDDMIFEALSGLINDKVCADVRAMKSKNVFFLLRDMMRADVFVFGGGSLLQNTTSNASLFYYLSVIFTARLLCRRSVMLANGIGPIRGGVFSKKLLEKLIKSAVGTFDYITVRDVNSQKYLQGLLPNREISLVPDPALLLLEDNINLRLGNPDRLVYIPCSAELKRQRICEKAVCESLAFAAKELGVKVSIVVLNKNEDLELARNLSGRLSDCEIRIPRDADGLATALSDARISVCQRYHGALFSAAIGVPTMCVSRDPKLISFCEEFALYGARDPNILCDPCKLKRAALDVIFHSADETKRRFDAAMECVRDRALKCLCEEK